MINTFLEVYCHTRAYLCREYQLFNFMRLPILIIILFSISFSAFGQYDNYRDQLVNYNNQNVHGLFVIQRLLELYNQEINKYVDLDSYQLNAFGNEDLPKNIFEDPKHEFYKEEQPLKIYYALNQEIPDEMRTTLNNFYATTSAINDLRWEVADFMSTADFNQPENLGTMYEMLESCVDLFDQYYNLQKPLFEKVRQSAKSQVSKQEPFVKLIFEYYLLTRQILHNVRNKSLPKASRPAKQIEVLTQKILTNPTPFKNNSVNRESKKRIDNNVKKFLKLYQDYISGMKTPVENSQYGEHYYYHNNKLLNRLNYSGVGVLYEFNELIRNNDRSFPLLMEIPHFFKVIYPERKSKVELLSDDKEKVIQLDQAKMVFELPTTMKGRNVKTQEITVPKSKETMEFEFYDHQLLDGDIVSINFNGDWILRNHSLESTPFKLIVNLNKKGKNFLIVHAENEGSKPPNTVAIKYRPIKRKKEVLLNCSLSNSQLIDIILE